MLQQLRAGYPGRPARFPHSVVLCGMRDPRDYRMGAAGSPFNIAAKSLRMGDFSHEETLALLHQHTKDTGQAFAPEALEAVWTLTCGQPWLVNALANVACFENKALCEDRSRTVTSDDIAAAREERIVNGGGRIEREYALGSGRVDLLIVWPLAGRVQEFVVECKVVREYNGLESVMDEGVEQTARYVDRCAAEAGHLVVIDRRENRSWEEKVFHLRRHSAHQRRGHGAVPVDVWGM